MLCESYIFIKTVSQKKIIANFDLNFVVLKKMY